MTDIGIMSMHRIFNYGSFLQGYGLKQLVLAECNDARIQFLDYHPGAPLVSSSEGNSRGISRVLKKVSEYGKVKASLADKLRFFNHKRSYAGKYFPLLGLPSEPNYDYSVDLQIIGSDEVFNCVQSNSNVGFSPDLFGFNSAARHVISYAGSFGNTTIEKIRRYDLETSLTEYFSRFSEISVRDENSHAIVKELTGIDASINVDPVLAYDYMRLCTEVPDAKLIQDPYLIVYGYSGRFTPAENQAISSFAKEKGLKIVCVGGVQDCCERFLDCSPFEVLGLFRDASFVVTDTFHGTIFSIINKRNFTTLIRRSSGDGYGNEEKLGYLLRSLGLEECGNYDLSKQSLLTAFEKRLDYPAVEIKLAGARSAASAYIRRNLQRIGTP